MTRQAALKWNWAVLNDNLLTIRDGWGSICGQSEVNYRMSEREYMARDAFEEYISEINKAYTRGDATEHTHRPALKTLI